MSVCFRGAADFRRIAVSRRTTFRPIERRNDHGSARRRKRIAPHLGDDIDDLVRDLRPMCLHLCKFGLGDQIMQTGFEARPLARRRPLGPRVWPVLDPQIEKSKIIKPRRVWH